MTNSRRVRAPGGHRQRGGEADARAPLPARRSRAAAQKTISGARAELDDDEGLHGRSPQRTGLQDYVYGVNYAMMLSMSTSSRSSYHHGALRPALIAAARALCSTRAAPTRSGLREAARRVGVSPTATYRHFRDKEALLAALAVEGFREFGAALAASGRAPEPLSAMGAAYVDFALSRPGMFRLMFSPLLAARRDDAELQAAADDAFATLAAASARAPTRPPSRRIPRPRSPPGRWFTASRISSSTGCCRKRARRRSSRRSSTPPKDAPGLDFLRPRVGPPSALPLFSSPQTA